jgi:hypothetical protein
VEGTPPYGYRLAPKEKQDEKTRTHDIVPDAAAAVLAGLQLCVQGAKLDKISAYLRQRFTGLSLIGSGC